MIILSAHVSPLPRLRRKVCPDDFFNGYHFKNILRGQEDVSEVFGMASFRETEDQLVFQIPLKVKTLPPKSSLI